LHKVLRLKNSSSELDRLKELLLDEELKKLKKLEEKVDTLDFEARDDATIMKRVTPAISKGISENKETMIDALYPIMGGMISKYVTQAIKELMETINKKIEQGLSFERIRRKAKSKLTGVSETELLLEESTDAMISSIFVVHKETSLLIAEAHLENKEIDDAHMVASMASAIKDFINDWMKHSDTIDEVQLLSYGNATLYIESAGSVFLVAFLDAEPDHEQRSKINTFFASLVKKYAKTFQTFDGEYSSEHFVELSREIKDYLYAQEAIHTIQKRNPAKILFVLLGILFSAYGVYLLNNWYVEKTLEDTIHTQTGEEVSIDINADYVHIEGQVRSIDVMYKIEEIIRGIDRKPKHIINELSVPLSYLDDRLKQIKGIEENNVSLAVEKKLIALEQKYENEIDILEKKAKYLEEELNTSKKMWSEFLRREKNGNKIF